MLRAVPSSVRLGCLSGPASSEDVKQVIPLRVASHDSNHSDDYAEAGKQITQ